MSIAGSSRANRRTGAARDGPICVIGAGIAGAAAAFHLVEAGCREVIVIDAAEPLAGTTPAGAGFVARFGADHNRRLGGCTVALQEYGLAFYRRLHDEGADLEFAHNGNVVLALTAGGFYLGFVGLLLGVPLAVGIKLLVLRGIDRYRASEAYTG